MSEEFSFQVWPYEGPEYISGDLSCDVCKKQLKVRIIGNIAGTCKVTWYRYTEEGVNIERICDDCSDPISNLINQIDNYNKTGDPNDYSWWEDDE